jgi:hypothetical protein
LCQKLPNAVQFGGGLPIEGIDHGETRKITAKRILVLQQEDALVALA